MSSSSGYTGSSGTGTSGTPTYPTTTQAIVNQQQKSQSPAKGASSAHQQGQATQQREHNVKEKYNVIKVPVDKVQQAGLNKPKSKSPNWGAGGGYLNQAKFHYSDPYQTVDYSYHYQQQQQQFPSPALPQYIHQTGQYPLPQMDPNYFQYGAYHYNYCGTGFPYAPAPECNTGPNPQYPRQADAARSNVSNVSKEEPEIVKWLTSMKNNLAGIRQVLEKHNNQSRVATPIPTPESKLTNQIIIQFNGLLNQFNQASTTLFRQAQQPNSSSIMSGGAQSTQVASPQVSPRMNQMSEMKQTMNEADIYNLFNRTRQLAQQLLQRLSNSSLQTKASSRGNNQRPGPDGGAGAGYRDLSDHPL